MNNASKGKGSLVKKNEFGMFCADVDGKPFEFEQWGAEFASDVLADIFAMVGEPLATACAAVSMGGGGATQITPDLAGTVMRALMLNLKSDKQAVLDIIKALTSRGVLCKGARIDFDDFYKGSFGLMMKVAKVGFEVHYGNFSDAVLTPLGFSPKGKPTASTPRS